VIIAFWIAANSWLFVREIWPRLRPGGPPPFTIDLADEAAEYAIRWTVYIGGKDGGHARTWVTYLPADDTFELSGEFRLWSTIRRDVEPETMIDCTYRVTREGQLLELQAGGYQTVLNVEVEGVVAGRVERGWLASRVKAGVRGLSQPLIEVELPPVEVPFRASVLNPLQPFNKIRGLAPGQTWQMPYFDPMEALAERLLPGRGAGREFVHAKVLPVQPLPDIPLRMGPNMPEVLRGGVPCLAVQYSDPDFAATTWVRHADSVVLRQEVTREGETLILNRD
jgi:hypothetical protein